MSPTETGSGTNDLAGNRFRIDLDFGRLNKAHRISINRPLGLALDLGTSGFRAHILDLTNNGRLTAAVATRRHPLPGGNVMDHLHFTLDAGADTARRLIISAVNHLLNESGCDGNRIGLVALCGNPIQLSLFQGIEIRDLAYAGKQKRAKLGVAPPSRDARVIGPSEVPGLEINSEANIIIPPAVLHEIGADALALIIQSDLEKRPEVCLAIDYGTNAEMALSVRGKISTGSAAAGPALEGQHINHGMLALPGAICDINRIGRPEENAELWQTVLLDERLNPSSGEDLHIGSGHVTHRRQPPTGITGTGVVALLAEAISAGLIRLPRIHTSDGRLYLSSDIRFNQTDLMEAGRAIGAIRAGMVTLCRKAGIAPSDIETVFMAGAAGTAMDPLKARAVGLLPPCVRQVRQLGNTSLSAARELLLNSKALVKMQAVADRLRSGHCMFARSEAFKNAYLLELSYWEEGLPFSEYRGFLKRFGLPDWPDPRKQIRPAARRKTETLIPQGIGWRVTGSPDTRAKLSYDGCTGSGRCVSACPERALSLDCEKGRHLTLNFSRCRGTGCRRCEQACPEQALKWERFTDALDPLSSGGK